LTFLKIHRYALFPFLKIQCYAVFSFLKTHRCAAFPFPFRTKGIRYRMHRAYRVKIEKWRFNSISFVVLGKYYNRVVNTA
jgi:hypothetical protein